MPPPPSPGMTKSKLAQIFVAGFILITFGSWGHRGGHRIALTGPVYYTALATLCVVVYFLGTTRSSGGPPVFGGSNERAPIDDAALLDRDFAVPLTEQRLSARQELARLIAIDENFSLVLFEDFVCSLFATAHEASATGKLEALWPYIAPAARAMIQKIAGGRIGDVAVEAIRYESVQGASQPRSKVSVAVRFTSTCAAPGANGLENWRFVERWRFSREAKARSKPPGVATAVACPSCGAPLGDISAETCAHCNQVTGGGLFDWYVDDVTLFEEKKIEAIDGGAFEQPKTVLSPRAEQRCQALAMRDPQFGWDQFEKRVNLIVNELSAARSEQSWKRARPFMSDGLFRAEMARMDARARTSTTGHVPQMAFLKLDLVDVETDKFFDAITLRVWFKETLSGKSHEGSEYWTLLRGRARSGTATIEKVCPSCGGALDISMAGACKYCNANVTSGQFDWVLGRIENPSAYVG